MEVTESQVREAIRFLETALDKVDNASFVGGIDCEQICELINEKIDELTNELEGFE